MNEEYIEEIVERVLEKVLLRLKQPPEERDTRTPNNILILDWGHVAGEPEYVLSGKVLGYGSSYGMKVDLKRGALYNVKTGKLSISGEGLDECPVKVCGTAVKFEKDRYLIQDKMYIATLHSLKVSESIKSQLEGEKLRTAAVLLRIAEHCVDPA